MQVLWREFRKDEFGERLADLNPWLQSRDCICKQILNTFGKNSKYAINK